MAERKLNLDIAGAVAELESLIKKVLPKNIMYRLLLGKGLEFDGYRDYSPVDDADLIDWKATVRAQKPLVRRYIEERDLKFMFVIDVSDNMVFGSTEKLKCEYVAEMVAALSHLILGTGDRIGFVLFNDKVVVTRMPELGNRQFEILVHEISNPLIYGGDSRLTEVLNYLMGTLPKSTSMVFLISDFVKVDETYLTTFENFSTLFETVAMVVRDPLDITLPDLNKEVVVENISTREKLLVNPKVAKQIYETNAAVQLNKMKNVFRDSNMDFLEMSTAESFSPQIATFLKERILGGRIIRKQNVS